MDCDVVEATAGAAGKLPARRVPGMEVFDEPPLGGQVQGDTVVGDGLRLTVDLGGVGTPGLWWWHDVVDGIQEVAETMVIYGVDAPTDEARQLTAILTEQAAHLVAAVKTFPRFKGIEPHLREIHELEHRADGLSRAAIAGLFTPGDDPLRVIKWMDIYRELEETIDAAEDTGEIIERIVAKSS